jgi:hypothetical protein
MNPKREKEVYSEVGLKINARLQASQVIYQTGFAVIVEAVSTLQIHIAASGGLAHRLPS